MLRQCFMGLITALISLLGMGPASAAPITRSYDFVATFSDGPYASVFGSLTVTFDPLVTSQIQTDSLIFNLPGSYLPTNSFYRVHGGSLYTGNSCDAESCKLYLYRDVFSLGFAVFQNGNVGGIGNFVYTVAATGRQYDSNSLSVVHTNVSAVPEPFVWMTMLLGFGALGGVMRRGDKTKRFRTMLPS